MTTEHTLSHLMQNLWALEKALKQPKVSKQNATIHLCKETVLISKQSHDSVVFFIVLSGIKNPHVYAFNLTMSGWVGGRGKGERGVGMKAVILWDGTWTEYFG